MHEHVTVIIPNWNGRPLLEQYLPALAAQTYGDFNIIVVDNGSRDGSAAWLAEQWPSVQVMHNESNLGFAAANNMAIRATRDEFIVTLNNDVRTEPDWLAELVAAANVGAGMVASRILLATHIGKLDSAGIEVDRAGVARNRGWGQPAANAGVGATVFGPSGAAALYRRSMLDEIGLFDEDFFAYYEDVDLAWRGQWAGWQCLYAPMAVAHHVHSATSVQGSPFKTRLLARNRIWAWLKNYPFPQLLWYCPAIWTHDLLSLGLALASGRFQGALEGRAQALKGLPRMLAKRREIICRVPASSMMARLRPLMHSSAIYPKV
jgi:GT2 family glycosyltransferase